MTISLEDRGRALEDEFFNKENAKKIEALKEKLDDKRSREDLRKASGMTDDAVLDKLVELGLARCKTTSVHPFCKRRTPRTSKPVRLATNYLNRGSPRPLSPSCSRRGKRI